jgi:hypothetical protein
MQKNIFGVFFLLLAIVLVVAWRTAPHPGYVRAASSLCSTEASLDDLVSCIKGYLPGKDSELFVVPNASQITDWKSVVEDMLEGQCTGITIPVSLNTNFSTLLLTEDSEDYCVFYEDLDSDDSGKVDLGWGTVIVRKNPDRDLGIHIAHPLNDSNTPEQGISLFKSSGARNYVLNGSHRGANSTVSSCQASYEIADSAHDTATMFHAAIEEMESFYTTNSRSVTSIQFHGMGVSSCAGVDVYLTHGSSSTPESTDVVVALKTNLIAQQPSWVVKVPGDTPVCSLNGTDNVQGRLINGVAAASVCSTIAPSYNQRFIHAEQKFDFRSASDWSTALNNTFTAATFSISGTITEGGTGLSGVSVDGGALGAATTDASGNYTLTGGAAGTTYVVTPTKSNYKFNIATLSVAITDLDKTAQNFIASESVSPTVSSLSPADGASSASVTSDLVITFSESVDVESGNVTIKKIADDSTIETISVTSGNVTGSGTVTITVNPASTLESETDYYVQVDATAFDDGASNSYAGISDASTWNFTTADVVSPSLLTLSPADNAVSVGTNDNLLVPLVMTFSESVDVETGSMLLKRTSDDVVMDTIDVTSDQVTGSGTATITVTLTTSIELEGETSYYVQVDATAFDDSASNSYAGISDATTWNFTTSVTGSPLSGPSSSAIPISTLIQRGQKIDASTSSPDGGAAATRIDAPVYNLGGSPVFVIQEQGNSIDVHYQSPVEFTVRVSGHRALKRYVFTSAPLDADATGVALLIAPKTSPFQLHFGEDVNIDLDRDGVYDIVIELISIAHHTAHFFIRPLRNEEPEAPKRIPASVPSSAGQASEQTKNESPLADGSLVKYPESPRVFLIERGKIRWIRDEQSFEKLRLSWDAIITLDPGQIPMNEGEPMAFSDDSATETSVDEASDQEGVPVIVNELLQPSEQGVGSPSFESNVSTLASGAAISQEPAEQATLESFEGTLIKYALSSRVFLINHGRKRWIQDEETFEALRYDWSAVRILDESEVFDDGETIRIAQGTALPSLQFGAQGEEVSVLQKQLNALGFPLAQTGPGSPGNETVFFGTRTQAALIRFQEAVSIQANGVLNFATKTHLSIMHVEG